MTRAMSVVAAFLGKSEQGRKKVQAFMTLETLKPSDYRSADRRGNLLRKKFSSISRSFMSRTENYGHNSKPVAVSKVMADLKTSVADADVDADVGVEAQTTPQKRRLKLRRNGRRSGGRDRKCSNVTSKFYDGSVSSVLC